MLLNNLGAYNQHIRMISEALSDTEDSSIDAENVALHHRNNLYFQIYKLKRGILNLNNISQCHWFDQINAALLSIRDLFQKY